MTPDEADTFRFALKHGCKHQNVPFKVTDLDSEPAIT